MTITTISDLDTQNKAYESAADLKGGDVIGFIGDLGAGKTTFIKGICRYFGIEQQVTSPTFTIINEYKTVKNKDKIKKIVHIDCYRLESESQLYDLGIDEYLNDRSSLILIEWADKIKNILPQRTIFIHLSHLTGDRRKITIQQLNSKIIS